MCFVQSLPRRPFVIRVEILSAGARLFFRSNLPCRYSIKSTYRLFCRHMFLWLQMLWKLGKRHNNCFENWILFSFYLFLDSFTHRPVVLYVGPRSAFAKSHLALFHKIWSIVVAFLFSCGRWLVPDEIERGRNNLLVFWFPLKKNLIICYLLSPSWRIAVNYPTYFAFSFSFGFSHVERMRPLCCIISDNVMAVQGLAMPLNGRT